MDNEGVVCWNNTRIIETVGHIDRCSCMNFNDEMDDNTKYTNYKMYTSNDYRSAVYHQTLFP